MWEFSIDEYPKKKKKFRRERKAQNPTYAPVFKVAHKNLIWRMCLIWGIEGQSQAMRGLR